MGTVQTVNYDRGRFYQLLHRNDNDGLYYRSFYCGTWQPWRKLMSKDSPEATHMHNITATNGNTYNAYPKGMSYSLITGGAKTQQGQDDNSEFPIYGTVTTINHSIYRFYQIIRNWAGQGLYERCYEARNGWWPWRRLDSGNVYKTASFTLDMSCMNCFVRCNSAAGMTVTVPTDASVPFPMATDITILREGNGDVSIAPASGVGIHSVDYMRKIDGRFAAVTLRKFGKDAWFLVGQLTS
jgi:hypothetical protein